MLLLFLILFNLSVPLINYCAAAPTNPSLSEVLERLENDPSPLTLGRLFFINTIKAEIAARSTFREAARAIELREEAIARGLNAEQIEQLSANALGYNTDSSRAAAAPLTADDIVLAFAQQNCIPVISVDTDGNKDFNPESRRINFSDNPYATYQPASTTEQPIPVDFNSYRYGCRLEEIKEEQAKSKSIVPRPSYYRQ